MAVTKIWAIHDSVSRVVDYCSNPEKTRLTDLEQVLIYAANKAKALDEGEQSYAVTGVNCRAETAAQEMSATQRRFGKTGGNVAYHAYQSFKTGEVSAAECHRIGLETARRLWGDSYQVLVATHFNTGTYHNHFVVNSVGMWDGRKLKAKYGVYYALRAMSDHICKEYGLSVVQNPQRHKTARSVYFAEKNGEPTRFNLMREALDRALSLCSSWSEMTTVLRKLGYEFECGPNHKYATIRPFRSKKCTRTFRLGTAYKKEAMRERLLENQRDYRVTQSYYAFLRPYSRSYARENPPTEAYYRKRDFYFKAPRMLETSLVSLCMKIMSVLITVVLYGRMIEIYLYCSVSPIPFATMTNREWGQIGNNYLKGLFALGFQGFLIMICVGIYAVLVNNMVIADNLHTAIFSIAAYTVLLCFNLLKSGALAKSLFHAH